ncbi:MAG TPA: hybrid sensor histidine kinase/response regulator [bacterium]|nr:hybrid sensor histidine kinase/response regulator [bacterium]
MVPEKQILLVDDEASVRGVWQRYLERWGYSYDLASCGKQGLELARAGAYQIVITDLAMPDVTGQVLLRTLKQERPELAVIVVTGHGTVEVAVEIMKAGAYDFITKPINFVHAELVIKNCLEQMQAQQETRRLQRLAADLEALNDLKEKFIAITNHELRTPVSVIRNVAEALEHVVNGDAEARPLVEMLSRSSAQLAEIVQQMHEISHAKSDRLHLKLSRFPLAALCQEVVAECWLVLQQRRLHLTWCIPDELSIQADRAKFKKVLRELVQNAIKFTADEGSIAIEAHRDSDNRLRLTVTDTGVGIPKENLDRIFELFYEVGDALHHHSSAADFLGGGMGVGLSIVNDIVSAHQGTVEVASTVGKGSTFTVILPPGGAEAGAGGGQ